jgi:hypothetical protein
MSPDLNLKISIHKTQTVATHVFKYCIVIFNTDLEPTLKMSSEIQYVCILLTLVDLNTAILNKVTVMHEK